MELFNVNNIYKDFKYPNSIKKIMELQLVDFEWWYLMDKNNVETRITELAKRYPNRKLIPFARRDDCDDIACFEIGKGDKVQIIHDYASSGYEQRKEYECFWDWFKSAIDELIEETEE